MCWWSWRRGAAVSRSAGSPGIRNTGHRSARRNGVAQQTVHEWLARYANGGLAWLADRSSRPASCPHQMPAVVEARIAGIGHVRNEWDSGRESHLVEPRMGSVGSPVLVWLVPVDRFGADIWLAIITCEYERTITRGCLSLCLAPDTADLVLYGQMILDQLDELKARLATQILPDLCGQRQRVLARIGHVADDEDGNAVRIEHSACGTLCSFGKLVRQP